MSLQVLLPTVTIVRSAQPALALTTACPPQNVDIVGIICADGNKTNPPHRDMLDRQL